MKQNTDIASGAPRLHGAGRQTMCGSTPQRYEESAAPPASPAEPSPATPSLAPRVGEGAVCNM